MDEFFKELVGYARIIGRKTGYPVAVAYWEDGYEGELTVSCGDGERFWGIMRFLIRIGDIRVRVIFEYKDNRGDEQICEWEITKTNLQDDNYCSLLPLSIRIAHT